MTRAPLSKRVRGRLNRLLTRNPVVDRYYRGRAKEVLQRSFLESPAYEEIFLTGHPDRDSFLGFLDDAEQQTPNFRYRHRKMGRVLGGWRWKGLFAIRNRILPVIFSPDRRGIDFGGGAGPVSLRSVVVDSGEKDVFGRQIDHHRISDITSPVDYIFSSHTLEHIRDLDGVLRELREILKPGGDLILNLPAYSCVRWRYGEHSHRKFNDHQWTFHLDGTRVENLPRSMAVDRKIGEYFDIRLREYTGDNSIVILAKG